MSSYKASAFIKTGTILRYLIETRKGAAVGKAWPDSGQSADAFVNSRGEKIQESANVLHAMYALEELLKEIGFADIRPNDWKFFKRTLIPAADALMRADKGRGRLTDDLAKRINANARELRKGVLARADKITLRDGDGGWPTEWDSDLIWPVPWWLVLAFLGAFSLGLFVARTKLYDKAKDLLSPAESQVAPSDEE